MNYLDAAENLRRLADMFQALPIVADELQALGEVDQARGTIERARDNAQAQLTDLNASLDEGYALKTKLAATLTELQEGISAAEVAARQRADATITAAQEQADAILANAQRQVELADGLVAEAQARAAAADQRVADTTQTLSDLEAQILRAHNKVTEMLNAGVDG